MLLFMVSQLCDTAHGHRQMSVALHILVLMSLKTHFTADFNKYFIEMLKYNDKRLD